MKHMKKKLTAVLLAIAMVVTLLPISTVTANAQDRSDGSVTYGGTLVYDFPAQGATPEEAEFKVGSALQILRYLVRLSSIIKPEPAGAYSANGFWEYEQMDTTEGKEGIKVSDALQVLRRLVRLTNTAGRRVCTRNPHTETVEPGCEQRPTWVEFRSGVTATETPTGFYFITHCGCAGGDDNGIITPPPQTNVNAPGLSITETQHSSTGQITGATGPFNTPPAPTAPNGDPLPPWLTWTFDTNTGQYSITANPNHPDYPSDGVFDGTFSTTFKVGDEDVTITINVNINNSSDTFNLGLNPAALTFSMLPGNLDVGPKTSAATVTNMTTLAVVSNPTITYNPASPAPGWLNVDVTGTTISVSIDQTAAAAAFPPNPAGLAVAPEATLAFASHGSVAYLTVTLNMHAGTTPPPNNAETPPPDNGQTPPPDNGQTPPGNDNGGTPGNGDNGGDITQPSTDPTDPISPPSDTFPNPGRCNNRVSPAHNCAAPGATDEAPVCLYCGYCRPCDWYWFGTLHCGTCFRGSDCGALFGRGWCATCLECHECCAAGSCTATSAAGSATAGTGASTGACACATACQQTGPRCTVCNYSANCLFSGLGPAPNGALPWGLIIRDGGICTGCASLQERP
jgi:hypothetical protein